MKSWLLAILTTAVIVVICCKSNDVLASDDVNADQGTHPAVVAKKLETSGSVSTSSPRRSQPHQKTVDTSEKAGSQKSDAAKGQAWFDVDPDRARVPIAAKDPPSAKGSPAVKWAKDPVDFGYKVNGSNDFRMLPRFDPNQSPDSSMGRGEGASGEVGMNLHF